MSDQATQAAAPQTGKPQVTAVVVNWNGREDLLACLASLRQLRYPKQRLRPIVVDNASTDGSQDAVRASFPEVELIANETNAGYTAALNQGVERGLELGSQYFWMMNNDLRADPESLMRLVETAEENATIGVAGPVITDYDNPHIVTHAGYAIDFWTGRLKKLKIGRDVFAESNESISDVDSILGCSNLIRRAVFEQIGNYRSSYDVYFEDTDLNARAKRAGFRVVLVRDARVAHRNAATMDRFLGRRAYLLLRNLFLFELWNARLYHLPVFVPYFFLCHVPYFVVRGSVYALTARRGRRAS